ncbi:MAG: hypothetical protein AAF845_14795 [Bacteroidota bacterium]
MRLSTLSAVLLLGAAPALAQDAVRLAPGHPDLSPVAIESSLMAVYSGGTDGRLLGTITTTATPNDDGTVTVVTDAAAPEAGFVSQDSARYGASLAPIFLNQEGPGGQGTVAVDGMNVSGTYARGSMEPLPFDIDLEEAPFDPVSIPLVARSLPLRAGYEAVVPTFSPLQRVRETTLTVVGEEEVMGADGEAAMAWAIEEDGPGRDRRFFVDGATREIVQITISPNPETVITLVPTTEEALAEAAGPPADPIRPGDPALMADRLADYSENYTFKVVQPVQQDIGTSTRALTIDREAGTVTLVSTTEITMAGQSIRDSLVAAYPSFEPISRRLDQNGTLIEMSHADGEVRRTVTAEGEEPETEVTVFDEAVFGAGWLQEMIRVMPLAEGYRISFEGVGTSGEANPVLVSVIGQEEMDGGPAWIVEAVPASGPPTTYTIDDATREVLKSSFSPQVGVILETVPAEEAAMEE